MARGRDQQIEICCGKITLRKLSYDIDNMKKIIDVFFLNPKIQQPDNNFHSLHFATKMSNPTSGENLSLYEKIKDVRYDINFCRHGLIVVKAKLKNSLYSEVASIIPNQFRRIFVILNNDDFYDDDPTIDMDVVTKSNNNKTEKKTPFNMLTGSISNDPLPNSTPEQVIKNFKVQYFENHLKDVMSKIWNEREKRINPQEKMYWTKVWINLYRIIKTSYYNFFILGNYCDILTRGTISKIHSTIEDFLKIQEDRLKTINDKPVEFTLPEKSEKAVIYLDIENFTEKTDSPDQIQIQTKKFNDLTQKITRWIENKGIPQQDFWIKCLGDGYTLAFNDKYTAFDLAQFLHKKNSKKKDYRLHIGLHVGTISPVLDVVGNQDIIGSGINYAARIMDLSDGDHILASSEFTGGIKDDYNFKDINFINYGLQTFKHSKQKQVYNIVGPDFGESAVPKKIKKNS